MSGTFHDFLMTVRGWAVRREADRTLLLDEVRALGELRFGAARLPVEAVDRGPVNVLVPTDAPEVRRVDDWRWFGQRMTGSGTTGLDEVRVDEHDVIEQDTTRPSLGGAFVQPVLLAALTGIGRAVVNDVVRFVRSRKRAHSHASATTAQADPTVQEVVGELAASSFAAELFEVDGASALDAGRALDRHRRNARTLASHNPARYRARAIGDLLVSDTPVVSLRTSGEA